MKYTVP